MLRNLDIWFIRGSLELSVKDSQAKINLNSDLNGFPSAIFLKSFYIFLTAYLNYYKMHN